MLPALLARQPQPETAELGQALLWALDTATAAHAAAATSDAGAVPLLVAEAAADAPPDGIVTGPGAAAAHSAAISAATAPGTASGVAGGRGICATRCRCSGERGSAWRGPRSDQPQGC